MFWKRFFTLIVRCFVVLLSQCNIDCFIPSLVKFTAHSPSNTSFHVTQLLQFTQCGRNVSVNWESFVNVSDANCNSEIGEQKQRTVCCRDSLLKNSWENALWWEVRLLATDENMQTTVKTNLVMKVRGTLWHRKEGEEFRLTLAYKWAKKWAVDTLVQRG